MKKTGLKLSLLVIAAATIAGASPILSENFEGGVTDGFVGSTGVLSNTIFTLVQGTVDLLGPTYFPTLCSAPTADNCLDTEGSTGGGNSTLGQIQTTNATVYGPGTYILSFDLNGWSQPGTTAIATVNVTLGSFINQSITVDGSLNPYPLVVIPFTVASSTSASLTFTTTTTNQGFAGGILDNIQINAVPEPASVLLVGLGLGCLGLAAKRRQSVR